LGTLLLDLLTEREERTDAFTLQSARRFAIPLLGRRLVAAIDWLDQQPDTAGVSVGSVGSVGLFAADAAAAAALLAAAERPGRVHAVVCRDSRPDLVGDALERVRTPVLMIIGDNKDFLELNRQTALRLPRRTKSTLRAAPYPYPGPEPDAHRRPEPETLRQVAAAARGWCLHPGVDQPHAARP
jgi:dienelactone hydrolase